MICCHIYKYNKKIENKINVFIKKWIIRIIFQLIYIFAKASTILWSIVLILKTGIQPILPEWNYPKQLAALLTTTKILRLLKIYHRHLRPFIEWSIVIPLHLSHSELPTTLVGQSPPINVVPPKKIDAGPDSGRGRPIAVAPIGIGVNVLHSGHWADNSFSANRPLSAKRVGL
jgi:hypothetical protein